MFTDKHNSLTKPPKRLFGVIIERLKVEKNLKLFKEKFSVSLAALAVSTALIVAALIVLNLEFTESESGFFVSMIFSDTLAVIAYYKYFTLAVLESMPIVSITISLAAIALVMASLRFAVVYHDKILAFNKVINKK